MVWSFIKLVSWVVVVVVVVKVVGRLLMFTSHTRQGAVTM